MIEGRSWPDPLGPVPICSEPLGLGPVLPVQVGYSRFVGTASRGCTCGDIGRPSFELRPLPPSTSMFAFSGAHRSGLKRVGAGWSGLERVGAGPSLAEAVQLTGRGSRNLRPTDFNQI